MKNFRLILICAPLLLNGCLFSVSKPSDDSGIARLDIYTEKTEDGDELEARVETILDKDKHVVFNQDSVGLFTKSVDLPAGTYLVKASCERKNGFATIVKTQLEVQEGELIVMEPFWVDPDSLRYIGYMRKRVCGINFNRQ
ncbi:MAG: carboxypeptidase-like regulatory domain-containing protein [Proteobacteria bacterium]|jgi:hypothetical protein|nr:carboxypeptidase-like regulatory domain-containing protein [Pseudomonadota bacterium]MCG6935714.1 carboxypeptidase-like regulatory domain-containing protein [Pseudomonadota bacterium]